MNQRIKQKLKPIVKRLLRKTPKLNYSTWQKANFSPALQALTTNKPELLLENKGMGERLDKKPFYPAVHKIEEGFNILYRDLKAYAQPNIPEIDEYDGLHSGTPMKTKPFPLCLKYLKKSLSNKYLFRYPATAGSVFARQEVFEYLVKEGFKAEATPTYDGLGVDNIVFTCSTTHAYTLILNLIMRPEDVIILTGPNYGLFAIEPERLNARVEILDLKAEDDYYVNPQALAKKIDEVNAQLKKQFQGKLDYTPKVAAFLNMNPHNPLGKVMNHKNQELLFAIGDVCLAKGVFVIDDLIYRELTFDQNDLALPLATNPKYFNNTISLFGLSKAYGLAGYRAGFVVAPLPICKGLSELIFATMDSIPVVQAQALAGAFNGTESRYRAFKNYFQPIIKEYIYRLHLLESLIYGINTIADTQDKRRIIKDINGYTSNKTLRMKLLKGVPELKIKAGTYPESGFFAVIDFTGLKGLKNRASGITLNSEADLIKYFYLKGKVKAIMGINMSWPNEAEMIGRINFGLDKKALINNFKIIKEAISELE